MNINRPALQLALRKLDFTVLVTRITISRFSTSQYWDGLKPLMVVRRLHSDISLLSGGGGQRVGRGASTFASGPLDQVREHNRAPGYLLPRFRRWLLVMEPLTSVTKPNNDPSH
ncbi:MAG: hypothetical protein ACR2IB_05980 [Pyrinomonadaceae bacterium]